MRIYRTSTSFSHFGVCTSLLLRVWEGCEVYLLLWCVLCGGGGMRGMEGNGKVGGMEGKGGGMGGMEGKGDGWKGRGEEWERWKGSW